MAAQMAVSLGAAFIIGREFFPTHWTWLVLTAFIVNSGNRGRGDVVYKGVLRVIGASFGTVAAELLGGAFGPRDSTSIVVIFAVLAVAGWLRTLNYAFWAGCVTAVLSLLYGYYGVTGAHLLVERLEQIALGALLGIAVAWLLTPVKTADVTRRRLADAIAPLTDLAAGAARGVPSQIAGGAKGFDAALVRLDEIAKPVTVQRWVLRHAPGPAARRQDPHIGDAVDAVRRCARPVRTLAALLAQQAESSPVDRDTARLFSSLAANTGEARRAIGRRPLTGRRTLAAGAEDLDPASDKALMHAAIRAVDVELARVTAVFAVPAPPSSPDELEQTSSRALPRQSSSQTPLVLEPEQKIRPEPEPRPRGAESDDRSRALG
jgi:uncharacterized membrane protein YccC